MRSVIVILVSLLCVNSFAAKIDKSAVLWKNSKGSIFGINSQTHECKITTDKNEFLIWKCMTKYPQKRGSWNITITPNSKKNLSKETDSDQRVVLIAFSQATTNVYQIDSIFVGAPDRKRLNKKRIETAIVGFGYKIKQCKMPCDDFDYAIVPSVLKAFGKDVDLMLNTRMLTIKYKNDKDKPVKVEYDLSELKSVFEILQEEAKKYNEIVEFKFIAKADWKY